MKNELLRANEVADLDPYKTREPKEKLPPHTYKGKLEFYSETGIEGGYWAFQDRDFITYDRADGVFGNTEVWDLNNPDRKGKTKDDAEVLHGEKWDLLPDPMEKEEDYYISSLYVGEEEGDKEADKRLMEKYEFKMKYSADRFNEKLGEGNWIMVDKSTAVDTKGKRYSAGGTPIAERPYGIRPGEITRATVEWQDGVIEQRQSDTLLVEKWDYEGFHMLNNGDKLTIFDIKDPQKVVWEEKISLKDVGTFVEDSNGLWIHNAQREVDIHKWGAYFMLRYPAKLELGEESVRNIKLAQERESLRKQAKSSEAS